ncbi:MAG: hypothetical protein ACRCSN_03380 [Dermatophilaceae bacterium]
MCESPGRRDLLAAGLLVATAATVTACTGDDDRSRGSGDRGRSEPGGGRSAPGHRLVLAPEVRLVDATAEPSVAFTRALLAAATAVVVCRPDSAEVSEAVPVATRLGIPLLVSGPQLRPELDRLGVRTVVATTPGSATSSDVGNREVVDSDAARSLPGLPLTRPARGPVLVVRQGATVPAVVEATLAATRATRAVAEVADIRADPEVRTALRASSEAPVAGFGDLGPAERFAARVRTTRRAPELPGGGLLPFPARRMVALYGHPETPALGMLGEQGPEAAVQRARALAARYAAALRQPVVPAFELIATVATGAAQRDGSYSRRTPVEVLRPWVEVAERAGVYVVVDLQPGRTDFLTQARAYEELLRRPGVGLALDPEWRLAPGQRHLRQIGSVGIDEVNAVGSWLDGLVRTRDLPPKVLVLHQFRPSMVRDRARLDTTLDHVQWLVHADGQGSQGDKQSTWTRLRAGLPAGTWLGWKNFEDEDDPMLSPEQTATRVRPVPWFVSYQ